MAPVDEPLEVAERLLDRVGERAEAMAVVTRGTSALTRFANSAIHQNVAEDSEHVLLKVVVDGRAAAGSANRTGDDALGRLVDRVIEAARVRPPDPDWPGVAPAAAVPDVEHHDGATASAGPDLRAGVVKAFVDASNGTEAAGYCSTSASVVGIATTAGLRAQRRQSSAVIDGIHQAGGGADGASHRSSARVGDLDGAEAGAEAAGRALASTEPVDLPPGRYEVVLEPACVADILRFLGYAGFNGKAVLDGTSFARPGEAQFDAAVSLWDDATDPRAVGLPFDAEGTPKGRLDLVVDGVTTGVAHDRRTARRAGARSTGHSAGPETFGAVPTNLFLGAGPRSHAELVASLRRGLLVCGFWYTRILDPRTQVVTGLTRNGLFLVEDGEVVAAVRNLRFTQSYVAALGPGNVIGVGSDARLVGSAHVPSVHLASFHFTGGAGG